MTTVRKFRDNAPEETEVVEAESLVEEVSIDGMCGVY
ncbi:mycofactocin precursor MftA [Microbacterium halotolerans]|nr:mycofactocin precursor MftA [Microbacterium halotolerans]